MPGPVKADSRQVIPTYLAVGLSCWAADGASAFPASFRLGETGDAVEDVDDAGDAEDADAAAGEAVCDGREEVKVAGWGPAPPVGCGGRVGIESPWIN
jgi:hypothetical protein